jgi:hypothetical protein
VQERAEGSTAILAATIAVEDEARSRSASIESLLKGVHDEAASR